VDGDDGSPWAGLGLEVTARAGPRVRIAGNWHLALLELYHRDPAADCYAVFQDDFRCVRNLRAYLERRPWPERSYANLFTFPSELERGKAVRNGRPGWFATAQNGRGAVALCFRRAEALALLTHRHLYDRIADPSRGWRSIDGGIVEAMKALGVREHCHYPSPVLHTGKVSTTDKRDAALALERTQRGWVWPAHYDHVGFPGDCFDAVEWLQAEAQ